MTPERWQAAKAVLDGALHRAPGERTAFLEQACGTDETLRRDVESLLAMAVAPTGFLEPPALRRVAESREDDSFGDSLSATVSGSDDLVYAQLEAALEPAYILGRELDAGGMARVYVARDERLGREVAVKVLRPELAAELSVERFTQEVRLTAALQEPHIVPVLAAGETAGGLPYYTMPFVRGESLRARLDRGGAMSLREAVAILRDVAKALAYAHAAGVVHRDIKPENVLLSSGTAVVTDFGIAKALRASAPATTGGRAGLTVAGLALGTPAYMAPEQAVADPALDHRADLYAWGLVAYEALAGRHPFAAHTTASALLIAHLAENPTPLGDVLPDLPAPMTEIVMRCLEKDPNRRPRNATDVLEALDLMDAAYATPARRAPSEHMFRLSEPVLRRLDRATLEPRLIGGALHYLENDSPPHVLLFCIHGLGHDASEFGDLLATTPHRAIAPTLYGFEAVAADGRVPLAVDAHLGLLRELLRDAVERLEPERVVLVGFSSGADLALRLLADASAGGPVSAHTRVPRVDACLALGPNLSLVTCFASRVFARLSDAGRQRSSHADDEGRALLADLRRLGDGAADLDEWLNVMTYQLHSLRKFRGDVAPLRRLAADIVRPFEQRDAEVFPEWFRAASARVAALRCVFERSSTHTALIQSLRLRNLDDGVLGPRYHEDALVLESTGDHFALVEPACIARHVDALLAAIR